LFIDLSTYANALLGSLVALPAGRQVAGVRLRCYLLYVCTVIRMVKNIFASSYNHFMITIDDFEKVEIKVGKVVEAAAVKESDKLIREVVDFSENGKKEFNVIFSEIRKWYKPEELVGKKFLFVTNLEPRVMPSYLLNAQGELEQENSQGLLLAITGSDGKPFLMSGEGFPVGARLQ